VNGSEQFHIKLSKNFDKTQQKLIRDRYRKNQAGLVKFVELLQKFLRILSVDPRPRPPLGHFEPWPKGSSRDGWELWKLEFKMPQLILVTRLCLVTHIRRLCLHCRSRGRASGHRFPGRAW